MKMADLVESIKFELTGGVIQLGIDDKALEQVVYKSIKELQRYINETRLITVPFSKCINMAGFECSSITSIYRTRAYGTSESDTSGGISDNDPMAAQWMIFSNGYTMYNMMDWVLNYAAYNVLNQIENTTSTDLAFDYDKNNEMLYINTLDTPNKITIKYVPVYKEPEEIKSDFWQDILLRLSVAYTKIIVGRIRSRYKMNNGLWEGDGEALLAEGREELAALQETLRANSQITYGID